LFYLFVLLATKLKVHVKMQLHMHLLLVDYTSVNIELIIVYVSFGRT